MKPNKKSYRKRQSSDEEEISLNKSSFTNGTDNPNAPLYSNFKVNRNIKRNIKLGLEASSKSNYDYHFFEETQAESPSVVDEPEDESQSPDLTGFNIHIPEKSVIEAAKKKREELRKYGVSQGLDYISISESAANKASSIMMFDEDVSPEEANSRLVREEQLEAIDEEFPEYNQDTLTFDPFKLSKLKGKPPPEMGSSHSETSEEGNPENLDEEVALWESEQIKKGKIQMAFDKSFTNELLDHHRHHETTVKPYMVPEEPEVLPIEQAFEIFESNLQKWSLEIEDNKGTLENLKEKVQQSSKNISIVTETLSQLREKHAFFMEAKSFFECFEGFLPDKLAELELLEKSLGNEEIDVKSLAESYFTDVPEDFQSLEKLVETLTIWMKEFPVEFGQAYVMLALPNLLELYVRYEVLFWDPFDDDNAISIPEMTWYRQILGLSTTREFMNCCKMVIERFILPVFKARRCSVDTEEDPLRLQASEDRFARELTLFNISFATAI